MPALTDPATKATIDLLNECDMRDQVGSYLNLPLPLTLHPNPDQVGSYLNLPLPVPLPIPLTLYPNPDQVGSYRVIVSYETPQLEEFSLCHSSRTLTLTLTLTV